MLGRGAGQATDRLEQTGMSFEIVIGLIAAIAVFELFEHVLLPLAALLREKHGRPVTGAEAMHGKPARVRQWRGASGQVTRIVTTIAPGKASAYISTIRVACQRERTSWRV